MNPWLLYGIPTALSALLGGTKAYKESGGDLTKTLTGGLFSGGLGLAGAGLAGGATRLAGQALAPLAAGAAEAVDAPGILGMGARLAASKTGQAALKTGIPAAAGLATSLAIPTVASAAGAPAANLATQAAGGAAAMGVGQPGTPGVYQFEKGAVPQTGQFGPTGAMGSTPWEAYNPLGQFATQRAVQELQTDTDIRGLKKLLAAETPYTEGAKKAEFLRNMAAAGIRQNIATQAAMLQNAQRTAQTIGINAASQMGQALAQQYQYS